MINVDSSLKIGERTLSGYRYSEIILQTEIITFIDDIHRYSPRYHVNRYFGNISSIVTIINEHC